MPLKKCHWCKERHEFCACCGIGIGYKHKYESHSFQVGEYVLCGHCQAELLLNSRIELIPKAGKEIERRWLNQDGAVTRKQLKGRKKTSITLTSPK